MNIYNTLAWGVLTVYAVIKNNDIAFAAFISPLIINLIATFMED